MYFCFQSRARVAISFKELKINFVSFIMLYSLTNDINLFQFSLLKSLCVSGTRDTHLLINTLEIFLLIFFFRLFQIICSSKLSIAATQMISLNAFVYSKEKAYWLTKEKGNSCILSDLKGTQSSDVFLWEIPLSHWK